MNPFKFSFPITVRISDINYGNHVGYQHFFSYFQDARIAYLHQFGFSERDIAGYGMLVAEATCQYKRELFHGDHIIVQCRVSLIRKKSFIMTYQIEKEGLLCATGSTTNMCFDSKNKKVIQLPEAFITAVEFYEGAMVKNA